MVGVHDKMNLSLIDWAIVFAVLGGMFYSVSTTKGLMKSVSDFLAAGRTAGRYVISISSGIAGLGAITIVYYLEMGYVSGFAMSWWGFSSALVILFITVSGWVVYRFRSTRCLTLPQFFEMRYSRRFRIFTGHRCICFRSYQFWDLSSCGRPILYLFLWVTRRTIWHFHFPDLDGYSFKYFSLFCLHRRSDCCDNC